jgi:NAD(P)H-hydrate epimerase
MVDEGIYPLLASSAGGAMVVPGGTGGDSAPFLREGTPGGGSGSSGLRQGRFSPDSLLLGPGWGRGDDRKPFLRRALAAEGEGLPLILDADAIALLDPGTVFHGGAILTPHGGELEALSGIPRERLLSNPPVVADLARRFNGTILFKSHVMIPAAPDGRIGFIDGMDPALAAGGSGDLLAGLCAAIAARMKAGERQSLPAWDPYAAAAASGALLTAASRRAGRVFYDPLKLAETAALVAGEAWLPLEAGFPTEAGFPMEETWGPDG